MRRKFIDINLLGTSFADELHSDVGANPIAINHDWYTKEDLVIRDSSGGGGNLLVIDVDYVLTTEATDLSDRVTAAVGSARTVWHAITIINAAYQTGDLYFSGKYIADNIEATDKIITGFRNSVYTSSLSSAGLPDFLSAGVTAYTIDLAASSDNVGLRFSAGYDGGYPIDYVYVIDSDQTEIWTVPASDISYLYAEYNPLTGVISYDEIQGLYTYSVLEPASPSTGDMWFNPNKNLMYSYNGAAWVIVYRILIGETTSDESGIVSVTTYNWTGYYETPYINRSDWTNVKPGSTATKNTDSNVVHNFNLPLFYIDVKLYISSSASLMDTFEIIDLDHQTSINSGYIITNVSGCAVSIQTGNGGLVSLTTAGVPIIIDTEDWYYKIVCKIKGIN